MFSAQKRIEKEKEKLKPFQGQVQTIFTGNTTI